jgi:hypothetical protein
VWNRARGCWNHVEWGPFNGPSNFKLTEAQIGDV